MNTVSIIGRLGNDPELTTTPNGKSVLELRVAITGFNSDEPDWVTVECWGKTAEAVNKYLSKGQRAAIEGSLHSQQWETKDGKKRSKVIVRAAKITFLDRAAKENSPETAEDTEAA